MSEPQYVWLAEWADYDSFVHAVYASPEAGVEVEKAKYGPPYVVRWEDVKKAEDEWCLTGHWEGVVHYSTQHSKTLVLTRHEVIPHPEAAARTPTDGAPTT